ncbi:hypothetical protein, partial [Legionella sp. ST3F1]|uniref:hypothetical protein n=5 Tax=unclassified Legionella TaxID=2622702 RepID=UPI003AF5841D
MAYCKKFINGINAINFSEKSVGVVKNALIAYAYQELKKESEAIDARLAQLPEKIEGNEAADEQLALYKKKQQEINGDIKARMLALRDLVKVNLEEPIALGDSALFISEFAQNFRNIRHLADTLADAPAPVKKLQTNLYVEMLAKLGQAEQEQQLQTLSLDNITDMIKQATLMYESNPDDVQLRNQCQRLAQMGFYEIVRRDCAKVGAAAEVAQYDEYKEFLSKLRTNLPGVGASAIIDNLSQYKDSNGHSVADLLAGVEGKFKITQKGDWDNSAKIGMVKERKALFDRLRFGQEDRREYARKTQANLTRDLFWARNIRDVELFTKSTVADDLFTGLAERRLLAGKEIFTPRQAEYIYPTTPAYQKFEEALDSLWRQREGYGIQSGSRIQVFTEADVKVPIPKATLKDPNPVERLLASDKRLILIPPETARGKPTLIQRSDKTLIKQCVLDIFAEEAVTPTVSISREGEISVNLYYFGLTEKFLDTIYTVIKSNGGFGRDFRGMFKKFTDSTEITDCLESVSIKGKSLAEIQSKLTQLGLTGEKAEACQKALDSIKASIPEESLKISQAGLGDGEILLRKLLELQSIASVQVVVNAINASEVQPVTYPKLKTAFALIRAGNYTQALEVPGIADSVETAYTRLSTLNLETVPLASQRAVGPVITKSQVMVTSARERRERAEALEAAFQSGENVAAKVEAVFLAEYRAMKDTLNLKGPDIERMEAEIKGMATEMARLVERTQKGEPAISDAEQNAYFSIVQQIAAAIKPTDITDVRFKVKHSSTGPISVVVLNSVGEPVLGSPVAVNLGSTKLPYSLVKPPGGEFIFSYGGSRGVIAPFEGLEEAYGKKGRFFTHSRLLGVGQYGSVKEVESLLFGLNQVVKKGYVPDADPDSPTFAAASRGNLRTRPITARDDPLYRIESDVLQNLSKAEKAQKGALSGGTQYWIEKDKPRKAAKKEQTVKLYQKDKTPDQYQILTERAKGDTLADVTNAELNLYTKGAIEYHDPSTRPESVPGKKTKDLKEMLALGQAIVSKAREFADLGFSHNDIKPENFLYKRNPDGSYQVKYIDWATGGFKATYHGDKKPLETIFTETFGAGLVTTTTKAGKYCSDASGRFVEETETGEIIFGVKPTLQILHGARNGTLPYISPKVLDITPEGGDRSAIPLSDTSKPNPEMNTVFDTPANPYMDDWSLTAMAFGICNRQAYFSLVRGRAVGDYVIPRVLEADGKDPQGLKITDLDNFNRYFACGGDVSRHDFESGAVYTKKDAIMFIPSNQREGAPLHIYRRLQGLQQSLAEAARLKGAQSPEQKLIDKIDAILTDARRVVASGQGYTKVELQEKLAAAQQCIKDYEQLNDLGHQQALAKGDVLQSVIRKTTATFHLLNETGKIKHLDILFTYPSNPEQVGQVKAVLDKVLPEDQINHIFLEDEAPGRHILKECIAQGQNELLKHLLSKITKSNPDFIAAVVKDGLLHYAAEQGMTDVFNSLVDTLKRAGASETEIFKFMMQEYGPGAERLATAPHIKWATNGLHIAVRNNNEVQLGTILALFPNEEAEKLVEETVSNLDDPGVLRTLVEATNNGPFKALEGCDQLNLTDQAYKSLQKVAAKRLELLQGKAKEIDVAQENLKWATAIAKFASEISEGGHDGQLASLEKGNFSHYAHQRLKEIDGTLSLQRSTFPEELYTSAIMAVAAERKRQKVTANSENAARVLDEATNNVIGSAKLAVAMAKLAGEIAAGKHDKDLNTLKALSSGGQALVLAIRELKRIDDTLTIDGLSVEQSKLVETAAGQRAQQKEALATAKVTARLSADANFKAIKESLHLCAVLGNKTLFNQIIAKYNALNPEPGKKIDAKTILAILLPPDDTSPYHLFMRDEGTQDLAWTNLEENRELAKTFLLKSPVGTEAYPSLIAAKNGNFAGVKELIRLGEKLELSAEEWTAFFKQSDESGKTLLNYALEQEQFTFLTELLAKVKTHCGAATEKTLVHLLSNPHPVNPLKNYLAVEKSEVKQFKVVNELLDAVCAKANPLKPELEQARLVALLVNKDWLIEKAQNEALHETLEKLLHSDALSIPFRRSLFAQLEKEAKDPAKTFFKGLLTDVSPREEIPVAPIVAIQLPPGIMQEVARQSGDLNELIAALASDREAVRELQERVDELTDAQRRLTEELRVEKLAVVEAQALQVKTARQLEETMSTVHRLEEETEQLVAKHNEKVELLEAAIARKDESSAQAASDLEQERLRHQSELEKLAERLSSAESTRDVLSERLARQSDELQSSLLKAEELNKRVLSLESRTSELQEELSVSKGETVEVRRSMQLALDEQVAATKLAKQEASSNFDA